ncbi:hypothetical protein NDU88_004442 [Pleurodeles waltl]|uniref:Uncharacterized protein n=1 Tax=Pleurodeles waltl TaxID=8319 RepID=A0AAV7SIY0_PLEWA|nr:hypothetical protein NDU88_004442 [Pleurodeles waltl]
MDGAPESLATCSVPVPLSVLCTQLQPCQGLGQRDEAQNGGSPSCTARAHVVPLVLMAPYNAKAEHKGVCRTPRKV